MLLLGLTPLIYEIFYVLFFIYLFYVILNQSYCIINHKSILSHILDLMSESSSDTASYKHKSRKINDLRDFVFQRVTELVTDFITHAKSVKYIGFFHYILYEHIYFVEENLMNKAISIVGFYLQGDFQIYLTDNWIK